MKQDKLNEVVRLHGLWLDKIPEGFRANLSGQDLSRLDLEDADLTHAILYNANLSHANLYNACLHKANLRHANLFSTCLSSANLSHANLYNADLSYANLSHAILYNTNLSYANLTYTNLTGVEGKTIVRFNGERHELIAVDGSIQIGCKNLSKEDWLRDGYTIGRDNNYTEEEINRYLDFIRKML